MQLKGLVRFFTILLILYSVYELSYTWFVRGHEKKMEARARNYVKLNYTPADQKYPGNKELQALYQDTLNQVYNDRLRRLLDSTKDQTVTYNFTGAVSYQKAKQEELNLGLDLQGGINVTMEVELVGLLKSMANNSKDPSFLKALDNANARKANSNADFITLFAEEYKKINPGGRLAAIFATANQDKIKVGDSDSKVLDAIRSEAKDAFNRTFRVLQTRIDQFGVAQPNINPDPDRQIITVELPGVQDRERVRKYLQSSANLQFWELYNVGEISNAITRANDAFKVMEGGSAKKDSTQKSDTSRQATTANATKDTTRKDTTGLLTKALKSDTGTKQTSQELSANTGADLGLGKYIQFIAPFQNPKGGIEYSSAIATVASNDTALVRSYLESEQLRGFFPADLVWMYGVPVSKDAKTANRLPLYAIKTFGREKAKLEGEVITDANQDYDPTTGEVQVEMKMNTSGTRIWGEMTKANVGKPIAIALDNLVYSAPNVRQPIENGISSISGGFTVDEANDLANILKAGKLPAPAKIVQEQQVGPTLGADAINGGLKAFGISFVIIFLLMLVYYNTSGWIANIALILNLLFTVGVLTGLGATLTAPGIAGLVLTIGMAVDTNVIIYERIKEELTRGKGYIPAINEGYKRSLPPVLDAHVTTLLTAIILFYFGLGPVKGFATTQILGILLSLFCGILVSRWISDWFTNKNRHLKYFTPISQRIFKHASFKFIEYRKVAYGISVVVLVLGISSFFHGFDEGVEFKGGRSYIVRFDVPVNADQVRDDLKAAFEGDNPIIKTIGDNRTLDITTAYLIDRTESNVDSLVETRLIQGLKNHLPAGLTYEKFDRQYKQQSKTVLPSISDDLKKGAVKATIFALIIIFIYIFIRFRDWRYSLGTIVSLLHDVLVTLIVFSFARSVVPFPLEIDQHFIAAILTVIGFSMNDTVIVFDRIREDSRMLKGASKEGIINKAINETLSRTIMTSLTVFLTILILFLVGGEVTRGFAFAMLIGVVTGTYSSIFVAAPILVDLGGKRGLGESASSAPGKQAAAPGKPAPAGS
ncbi:MAG TPA: protein translocase subunit SecDF [Chitinophagaceae bacterium]|nr:protein translocase subunit SecDF [Chitinophagaceae bacterium]